MESGEERVGSGAATGSRRRGRGGVDAAASAMVVDVADLDDGTHRVSITDRDRDVVLCAGVGTDAPRSSHDVVTLATESRRRGAAVRGAGDPADGRCEVVSAGGHMEEAQFHRDAEPVALAGPDGGAVFEEVCRAHGVRRRPVVVAGGGVVWGFLWVGYNVVLRTTCDPVAGVGAPGVRDDLSVPPGTPGTVDRPAGRLGSVRAVGRAAPTGDIVRRLGDAADA